MTTITLTLDDDDRGEAPDLPWSVVMTDAPDTIDPGSAGIGATLADALRDLADDLDRTHRDALVHYAPRAAYCSTADNRPHERRTHDAAAVTCPTCDRLAGTVHPDVDPERVAGGAR